MCLVDLITIFIDCLLANKVIGMAQSSNALREPTMDEILNSIREIIEENTAQANHVPAEQTNLVRQVAAQPVVSQPANRQSLNYTEANSQFAQQPTSQFAQQPTFPQQKPVTVDEAMQALAKRIGLTTDTTNTSAADTAASQHAYSEQFSDPEAHSESLQSEPSEVQHTEEVVHLFKSSSTHDETMTEVEKTYDPVGTDQIDSEFKPATKNEEQNADVKVTVQNQVSELLEKTETIAERELRPALATWLDKQLPILVERILREEISKVVKQLLLTKLS